MYMCALASEFTSQLEGYEGVTAQCHNCMFTVFLSLGRREYLWRGLRWELVGSMYYAVVSVSAGVEMEDLRWRFLTRAYRPFFTICFVVVSATVVWMWIGAKTCLNR